MSRVPLASADVIVKFRRSGHGSQAMPGQTFRNGTVGLTLSMFSDYVTVT